jgi:hypothetical protein
MKNFTQLLRKISLLIAFLLGSIDLFSQALPILVNGPQAATTYTPNFTGCVRVQIWGGGGGGGDADGNGGSGGGGGGGYSEGYVSVTNGVGISYTVGGGGAGSAAGKGGGAGTAGGNSTFGAGATGLVANGGGGGGAGAKSAAGGLGGTVSVGASVSNAVTNKGGAGGASANKNKGGGGGGGGAGGPLGAGGAGALSTGTGGNGGLSDGVGGGGGDGGDKDQDGANGIAPGGGGGGSGYNSTATDGGAGGAGRIMISTASNTCPGSTAVTSAFPQQSCQNNATGFNVLTATSTLVRGCGTPTVLYQWYFNTTNSNTVAGATAVGGATASTYTPPNNLAIGDRWYFCVAYATNNGCGQTATTQILASNAVQMTITANTAPTTAAAMAAISFCVGSSSALAGTNPLVGTGTWSIVSGPNTSLVQISNVNLRNATFTPTVNGVYVLRWTICAGSCNPCSSADVTITVNCGGACPACPVPFSHAIAGIQGEYVGSCLVNTCSGTYVDDGGAAGNYALNINQIYRVFCPSNPLSCVRATFTEFNTEATFDFLTIGNGPTQNSPPILQAPANLTTGRLSGNLNASAPFSFTSTHASGCLTMRFRSDFVTVGPGWNATISCVPCAGGPAGTDNNDCNNATATCTNQTVPVNASGPGISSDGCSGTVCPAGGENHANWYKVKILTAGTFGFNVVPTTATDDYDVTVYGPNVTCGALGSPIRCSDAYGNGGTTGVNNGDTDGVDATINSLAGNDAGINENVLGDKNLDFINATVGQEYLIMVDEWTPTGGGFSLNMLGTATLDCAILLPIELSEFKVEYFQESKSAEIKWRTESERENDYFTIEKSLNGLTFYEIAKVKGAGNSTKAIDYSIMDEDLAFGINYYRLKQTDFNGKYTYSNIVKVNPLEEENYNLIIYPNPTSGLTDLIYSCSKEEIAYVQVINSKGEIIFTKEVKCAKGLNYDYIDVTDYNNGLYFVKITTSAKTYVDKILKK